MERIHHRGSRRYHVVCRYHIGGEWMKAAKRDDNEKEIVEFLRACGARVQFMDKDAGFDLLVTYQGKHLVVEVKNPKRKWKLTDAEQETKRQIQHADGVYYILENENDARLMLIGFSMLVTQ